MLTLRLPNVDEEEEFLRAHRATSPEVPNFLHHYKEGMPLADYLQTLTEQQRGEHLGTDQVPETFLFAFAGARIVGRISIRHSLTAVLERIGGHIGYVVVPEFRRHGYATEMLRMAIEFARNNLGIDRILVTCDDDNVASIRTIEKNGGILENIVYAPENNKRKMRFWILAD